MKDRPFVCLMQGTDQGTVFVVKMPTHEILCARGRVPIHFRHELYEHPSAPVIRTVVRIYDQPQRPLAFEAFTNIEDQTQRAEFAALAAQETVLMLFYDEALHHRLAKQVSYGQNAAIPEILRQAEQILARIPQGQFDFDKAKREVMERTSL